MFCFTQAMDCARALMLLLAEIFNFSGAVIRIYTLLGLLIVKMFGICGVNEQRFHHALKTEASNLSKRMN